MKMIVLKSCPISEDGIGPARHEIELACKECPNRVPDPRVERLVEALEYIAGVAASEAHCGQCQTDGEIARAALAEYTGTEPGKGGE